MTFLVNLITPSVYEGIKSVYNFAQRTHEDILKKGRTDPQSKSPGVLKLFQTCLKEIPLLNNNAMEIETERIKTTCKCGDWFDDLIKATVKSYIVLLTFTNPRGISNIVKEGYHNKIVVRDFVHKTYIETARLVYNNPELFWHEFPPLEVKRNQRDTCNLIKSAIGEAITKMLPMKLVLKEYLQNNYVEDDFNDITKQINETQYANVKSMIDRDLANKEVEKENYFEEGKHGDIKEVKVDGTSDQDCIDMGDNFLKDINSKISKMEEKQDVDKEEPKNDEIFNKSKDSHSETDVDDRSKSEAASSSDVSHEKPKTEATNVKIPSVQSDEELKNILGKENVVIDPTQIKTTKGGSRKKETPNQSKFFEQYMK